MSVEFDTLETDVTKPGAVVDSVQLLIERLSELFIATATGNTKVKDLGDEFIAKADVLAEAVVANTSAEPKEPRPRKK
jgi:predicted RNA-binding Zn ribbon-like protein